MKTAKLESAAIKFIDKYQPTSPSEFDLGGWKLSGYNPLEFCDTLRDSKLAKKWAEIKKRIENETRN